MRSSKWAMAMVGVIALLVVTTAASASPPPTGLAHPLDPRFVNDDRPETIKSNPSGSTGYVLRVKMTGTYPGAKAVLGTTATGSAVYGNSPSGYGLYGYTKDGYAVYGQDAGTAQGRGYGGYFTSNTGVGVYGHSSAQSYVSNMYAPGVYGRSANGAGVYGVGNSSSWPGYGGYFKGRVGLGALGTGSSAQDGYAATFISQHYRGIYAESLGGWYDGYFAGIGGIYSAGGVWATTAVRTVVVNGGDEPLEPGDLVAIAGVVESPNGGQPLLAVRKADASNGAAVVGVVVQAMRAEEREIEEGIKMLDVQPVEGKASPQGYLAIVTNGLVPAVKVKVPPGGLKIGDFLTVSTLSGAAQKASLGTESEGAILGKVAGPVNAETGTVPVFVILR